MSAYDIDSAHHFLMIAKNARSEAEAEQVLRQMLAKTRYGTPEFNALVHGMCAVRRELRDTQKYIAMSVDPWFEVQS